MSTPSWTQGRVEALLAALESYGMVMSPAAAEALIGERVGEVAQLMRASKATARGYLTDETIAGMAESIVFSLSEESPGADLFDAPRTIDVPVAVMGRMVAGLAEACQIRFAESADPEHHRPRVLELVKCLSVIGTITSTHPVATRDEIPEDTSESTVAFPPALLRRVARYLDGAATTAEEGLTPPGFDADPTHLAQTFRDDSTTLRILTDTGGPGTPPTLRAL